MKLRIGAPLALCAAMGWSGSAGAQGTAKVRAQVQPVLKAGVGLKPLKALSEIGPRVQAAAFAEGKTWVAGDGFVSQVDDQGQVLDEIGLKLQGIRALSAYKPGILLAGAGRAVHAIDLKARTSELVVDLNGILIGMIPNDGLIRFGEIGGVASDGGKFLFVATEAGFSSSIFKIDVATKKVVEHAFAPGPTPSSLQYDGGNLFLVDRNSELLRRFDSSLKLSLKSIPVSVQGARAVLVKGDQIRAVVPGQRILVNQPAPIGASLLAPIKYEVSPGVIEKLKGVLTVNLKRKYALLVTGDVAESGFDCFWNDTVWMYKMLKAKGYAPQDIFVLYGNGIDFNCPNPMYKTAETVTDFAATPANLDMMLDGFKTGNAAKGIPKVDDNDSLFIWFFDHGGLSGSEATLCLWGGAQLASHIATKANAIPYEKRAIFMQQCFSGGFIPFMKNAKTYIATACRADETAHPSDTEKEVYGGKTYGHGEFNYYVISAFDRKYPTGAAINPDAFTANGKTSAKEANAWWVGHENRSETPQQNDMGGIGDGFNLN